MEKKLPDFASESEEADWWYARREVHDRNMAEAISDGRAQNLHEELLRKHGLVIDQRVNIPLASEDVRLAKEAASLQGIEYEQYLSVLLHEALQAKKAA